MLTPEPRNTNLPPWVTTSKVAQVLGCSRRRIRETIRSGALETVQLGRRRVVTTASLLRYLKLDSAEVLANLVEQMSA